MELGVIIVTHAGLADAFIGTVEMLSGPQSNLKAVGFQEGDNMMETANLLTSMVQNNPSDFTILFTDAYGATPTNAALLAISQCENAAVITGVNLVSVLQALELNGEDMGVEEVLNLVASEGKNGVRIITKEMVLNGT